MGWVSRASGRRSHPFSLFKYAPQHSSGRGLWNLVDDLNSANPLVWGNLLGDEPHHAVGVELATSWDDECLGQFTGLLVGDADDGAVGDLGMGDQDGLKLGGSDLIALILDHLLDPADDREPALFVHDRDVSATQPAVLIDHRVGPRR